MATLKQIIEKRVAGLPAFESQSHLPRLSSGLTRVVQALPAGPNLPWGDQGQSQGSVDGVAVVTSQGALLTRMIDLKEK